MVTFHGSSSVPTAPIAAAGLVGGYLVARESGIRPLGGIVLATTTSYCAWRWNNRRGPTTSAALVVTTLGAFGASHVLAKKIGAWPAVLTVSAVTAAAAFVLVDRY